MGLSVGSESAAIFIYLFSNCFMNVKSYFSDFGRVKFRS